MGIEIAGTESFVTKIRFKHLVDSNKKTQAMQVTITLVCESSLLANRNRTCSTIVAVTTLTFMQFWISVNFLR